MRSNLAAPILLFVAGCGTAIAQEPSPSAWSFDAAAEFRERYESSDHPVFGLSDPDHNDYTLQRLLLSAEAAHTSGFHAKVSLISGTTHSFDEHASPTQEDPVDVLEAYAEQSFTLDQGSFAVKAGRQQMTLGSQRLVSVRESPNIRRTFDGVRFTWKGAATIDAFYLRPVAPRDGAFDDHSTPAQQFWGIYSTLAIPQVPGLKADLYYLGLRTDNAVFAAGRADELRHSVGARLFGAAQAFDWNIEGVWQWGSFGRSNIRAWTLSADLGYSFKSLPFSPRFGLKADAISGDRNLSDHTLQTFNPLFPKLPYFSEANVATPANLLDIQPNLTLALAPKLTATVSWDALWKQAKADAFYAPPLAVVPNTASINARPIGSQTSLALEWKPSTHIDLAVTYVPFEPRTVARQAGGRSGSFFGTWVTARF